MASIRNCDDQLNLSEDNFSTLNKFRENVADLLSEEHDNHYLVKWLRARGFNIKKSEEMLRKSMAWRKKWGADTISEWQCPEVIARYDIGGRCGYDNEGCPVWIYKSACLDMKGMSLAARRADVIKEYIKKMEFTHKEFKDLSNKHNKRIHQAVLIDDLEGFTLKHLFQPGMDIILKIMAVIEANYPETLKRAYVVNAPTIFPLIFKLCKPFMSEDTKNKIKILGSNWKEELAKVIPKDQLPVHWGGTMLDPLTGDAYCSSLVKMGGVIPKSCYLKPSDLVDESKVKSILVESGQTISLESKVDKDNNVIRYTFWAEGYDIKFGIYYKESEAQSDKYLKELRRNSKVNCHQIPEEGTIECQQPGVYVFQFDNSYSWFQSKKISYVIEVLDPDVMSKDSEHTCAESSDVHLHTDVICDCTNSEPAKDSGNNATSDQGSISNNATPEQGLGNNVTKEQGKGKNATTEQAKGLGNNAASNLDEVKGLGPTTASYPQGDNGLGGSSISSSDSVEDVVNLEVTNVVGTL